MRVMPRSLFGRLLVLSLAATLCALAVAGVAIGGVLERFVTGNIDARLADRTLALGTAVRRDGRIDPAVVATLSSKIAAEEPWRIVTPRGSAGTLAALPIDPLPPRPHPPRADGPIPDPGPRPPLAGDVRPFDTRPDDGQHLHGVVADVPTDAGVATIAAAVPRRLIERPIRAALVPLALSLLALGLALAVAAVVQLRIGLRPLDRLRLSLAAVRAGERARVSDDQPLELRPLTAELNALLDQNAAQLANARGHVANLAHGLKTPLATLALELRAPGRDPDGALSAQAARIDRAIRHHLGRARADATGGGRQRTLLAPAVEGLIVALGRIHADRGIAAASDIPADIAAAIDPHDLDELLGNLLDNAWRFAARTVTVAAANEGGTVRITVADDGPGIPDHLREAATQPGWRLDEAGDGHGFGLAIARELAELHGGRLTLDSTPGGGLAAMVELPR